MASNTGRCTMDARELMGAYTVTVKVKRVKKCRWRLTVGSWLMGFVARLMWLNEIELIEEED